MSALERGVLQSAGEPFIERELALREIDGLQVRLWWLGGTATKVTLEDRKAQPPVHFEIKTPEGVSPNEVFNHPFSYWVDAPEVPKQGYQARETDGRGSQ